MGLELTIDGARFDDIAGFYAEVNRVFMAAESWRLGETLDGLDDMLRGGYGILQGAGPVSLRWHRMEKSRADLGFAATRRWLEGKLQPPGRFDGGRIRAQLAALENHGGPTYFDIICDIIAGHSHITLVAG